MASCVMVHRERKLVVLSATSCGRRMDPFELVHACRNDPFLFPFRVCSRECFDIRHAREVVDMIGGAKLLLARCIFG